MSDHIARSYNDIDGIAGQSRIHHKSNWMAHWTDRSCKTTEKDSLNYELKEDDHGARQRTLLGGSEIEKNISVFGKGSRKVRTVRTAKRLLTSSQNLKTEGHDWKQASPFPPALEWAFPEAETPSRNCNFEPPEDTVKYHNFFEKNNLVGPGSSKDDFIGSNSRAVPCGVDRTAPILSMGVGEGTNPSSSLLASKEHFVSNNFSSYSTFFIGENKTGYMMNSRRPGTSVNGQDGAFSFERSHQVPNLSAGGQMLRESTVSAKFKGKMLSQFYSSPQGIGSSGQQGVRIQLLESSTDSEGRETVKSSTVGLKNESSTDTDTMEMNAFQKNNPSAHPPSPSNKDLKVYQVAVALGRGDTGRELWNTDKKQKLHALPGAASSTDDKDTSSSRTQSLDVEHLFSNAEQAADSNSNAWPSSIDPSSRWVKRLKLGSSSDSLARGTQSSKMEEPSSREKANKLFCRIMEGSSEARSRKEKMVREKKSVGKVEDHTTSHNWIRRWCHNQASSAQKNKEAPAVSCAPESFKETPNKFQKKQFPSVAAMALMGKAMNGFRPCEFRKLGSSVVWNTKG